MSGLMGSVWWLLIALGVLITFHEFGHFWVARRCGVKVLRFSIGFGPPLWRWQGRDGTEYVIAALPLGGYVRMLDEREGEVPAHERDRAFNRKPVWQRMAIVAAGPLANLLLAFLLLWAMLVLGRPDYAPVVGQAKAIAAEAGLQPGDRIMQVGDRQTPTWSELQMALLTAALDRQPVTLAIQREPDQTLSRTLPLHHLPANTNELQALAAIGLIPRHLLVPAVVGSVREGSPAWGKLAEGDRITAIDASPVSTFEDIAPLVQALGMRGGPGMVEVERDGQRLALEITPERNPDGKGQPQWLLGITSAPAGPPPRDAVLRLNPLAAVPAAARETGYQVRQLVTTLTHALTGHVAVENTVAGPITIARAANAFAQRGPAWFLNFLALLSVSLALLNLLPIPVLDGGHLLYYLIELITRRPLDERVMAVGQYIGLAIIAGLMGLAFYNDILHLMS
ncbi:MAG: RIP metalloprotease RseP [Thermomonas hydrothermalis]|uniref:RIP metalloprotease RseP n=1 Tax=Thermomonas hydrothermalis TaxID=213588 RepID=UPI002353DA38|nr:RIP metalloprotease RseP [Thermomonas hydrothermalis]MCL6619917.1 RIP metalloprotease RseP [Thermomonas hydrothermalis]